MHFPSPSFQHNPPSYPQPSMSVSGIHGQLLEVTVVGCNKLKDTEWISRQDPYVCLEYGSTKVRTRTCTDGGKNPTFQEKFLLTLIEGLREITVVVWNSNTITYDDFIGSGKVQLQKVLSHGFDDTPWPLHTKTGRHAGEVRLILHYANANVNLATTFASSAPAYAGPSVLPYAATPTATAAAYPSPASHYPSQTPYPSPYPPNPAAVAYPSSSPYPPPPQPAGYPPHQPYPPPPAAYPPPAYPPPPHAPPYYQQGPYPGMYPPAPY